MNKNLRSVLFSLDAHCAGLTGSSEGVKLLLTLDKAPVAGEPIRFTVNAVNKQSVPKTLKVHFNAQAKEYNHSPLDTFWETHGVLQLAPLEGKFPLEPKPRPSTTFDLAPWFHRIFSLHPPAAKVVKQHILPTQYEDVVGDNVINLAVVLEDTATQERFLSSEEFNIASPQLKIEVPTEYSLLKKINPEGMMDGGAMLKNKSNLIFIS